MTKWLRRKTNSGEWNLHFSPFHVQSQLSLDHEMLFKLSNLLNKCCDVNIQIKSPSQYFRGYGIFLNFDPLRGILIDMILIWFLFIKCTDSSASIMKVWLVAAVISSIAGSLVAVKDQCEKDSSSSCCSGGDFSPVNPFSTLGKKLDELLDLIRAQVLQCGGGKWDSGPFLVQKAQDASQ